MARKKLNAEEQTARERLESRLLLTIRFIEGAEDFPSGKRLRNLVQDAAARGDLRSLRLMAREVDAMTIALPPHVRDGLEAVLRERLGVDREAERDELRKQAAIAIKRGTVSSEKERRRLEEYAEMLEAIGGDAPEIAAVRRLLSSG